MMNSALSAFVEGKVLAPGGDFAQGSYHVDAVNHLQLTFPMATRQCDHNIESVFPQLWKIN